MGRKRICDAAVRVLRETDNPAVGWGDSGLLHAVAEAAGLPHDGPRTERRVLDALRHTPGALVHRYARMPRVGLVSVFWLPEKAPPGTPEKASLGGQP